MRPICLALHGDLDIRGVEELASSLRLAAKTLSQCLRIAGTPFQVVWDAGAGSTLVDSPEQGVEEILRSSLRRGHLQLAAEATTRHGELRLAELNVRPGVKVRHQYDLVCTVWFREQLGKTAVAPFESALTDLLRSLAHSGHCDFGCVSDDIRLDGLPLERAQVGISSQLGRPTSRAILRNYSWVTFVSPELAEQISSDEPESSVYSVEPIGAYGLLVQFTPSLEDFTGEAIRHAHRVFSPVIARRPLRRNRLMTSYRLVWDDGAVGPVPVELGPGVSS